MTSRRVLLVSPGFHGYWQAIQGALTARGHYVTTHVYDVAPTLGSRIGNKLLHDLPDSLVPSRLRSAVTDRAICALRATDPQAVVIVKGDLLEDAFWQLLDERRLPRVTWLYDEVRRTQYTESGLSSIGPLATYSAADAETYGARHLPLAFDHRTQFAAQPQKAVTFIGARYPNRERSLSDLRDQGIPVRVYGRDWSRKVSDRLRTHTIHPCDLPSGPTLTRAEAYGVMAGSAATLNLHGDQDGFTMRTFEAAGTGGVQIVDRTDVADLYEIGTEVLAFSSSDELAEQSARAVREPTWGNTLRERSRARTLAEHTFDHRVTILESLWG
ncbi:glycosyltransferase [Dermatophilaceae bacterium Sec6.4]